MVTNNFYFFQSVIDKQTCQKIIDLGLSEMEKLKSQNERVDAWVGGEKDKFTHPTAIPKNELTTQQLKEKNLTENDVYVRDSQICWLDYNWLYEIIQSYIFKANELAGWNFDVDYSEVPQFTTYKNTGFYSWHKDGGSDRLAAYKRYIYGVTPIPLKPDGRLPEKYVTDPNMIGKVRKLSVTINISPPGSYDGGNLKFDYGPHSDGNRYHEVVEARDQGSIIIFPSFIDHTVTPITRGKRYSLVLWNLGDPFK